MFSSNPLSIQDFDLQIWFTCIPQWGWDMILLTDIFVWWCSFQANQNIPLSSYSLVWMTNVVELFYHSYYSSDFSDILFLSFLIRGSGQPFVTHMSNTHNYPTFLIINDANQLIFKSTLTMRSLCYHVSVSSHRSLLWKAATSSIQVSHLFMIASKTAGWQVVIIWYVLLLLSAAF